MKKTDLEILRFAIYVMTPIAAYWYFNTPEFMNKHVKPLQDQVFPVVPQEKLPTSREEIDALYQRMKEERSRNSKSNQ